MTVLLIVLYLERDEQYSSFFSRFELEHFFLSPISYGKEMVRFTEP